MAVKKEQEERARHDQWQRDHQQQNSHHAI
jgi:hypothetical protein